MFRGDKCVDWFASINPRKEDDALQMNFSLSAETSENAVLLKV